MWPKIFAITPSHQRPPLHCGCSFLGNRVALMERNYCSGILGMPHNGCLSSKLWYFKTGGLSWQWSLKTGFTVYDIRLDLSYGRYNFQIKTSRGHLTVLTKRSIVIICSTDIDILLHIPVHGIFKRLKNLYRNIAILVMLLGELSWCVTDIFSYIFRILSEAEIDTHLVAIAEKDWWWPVYRVTVEYIWTFDFCHESTFSALWLCGVL